MKQHRMLSMFTNPHYSNQPKLEGEKYNHYEHEREKKERRTSAFPFIHFGRFRVLSTPASSPLFWEICDPNFSTIVDRAKKLTTLLLGSVIYATPSVPNYRSFWQIKIHIFCHVSRYSVYIDA